MEIIILLLIISALSRLFSGNKEQQEQQQKQRTPSRPTQRTQQSQNTSRRSEAVTRAQGKHSQSKEPVMETVSIEERQRQQMEQFAEQMNPTATEAPVNTNELEITQHSINDNVIQNKQKKRMNRKQENFKKQMKSNLNRNGLVNSVLMSEVLGAPRARKPYRSVVADRNR